MYVDSLARAGQVAKARNTSEKMLTYANHLGLYSEKIALTGEQIGNFPQAFTHLALPPSRLTGNSIAADWQRPHRRHSRSVSSRMIALCWLYRLGALESRSDTSAGELFVGRGFETARDPDRQLRFPPVGPYDSSD
jgi:hypothetical protein